MNTLYVDNIILNGEKSSLYCENGTIAAIGEIHEADETLDGRGCVVMPPMLNSHTHAAMTLFRGNGDDLPLMEWLQTRVWPYEQDITKDEIYWGTRLAIIEMLRSGCTFFNDMYWDFHVCARAVEETGIRSLISAVFIDFGDKDQARRQRDLNERLYKEASQYSDRVQFAVAPHAIYTVGEEMLRWAADFTRENNLKFHIHLSETEQEVKDCMAEHGCSPVEYLDRLGAVSERLVAAHTVWLSDRDIALLGEHKAVCAHNPVSNMKLAVGGVYPYKKLQEAGAITALATDGAGSNNNLDLFEEMKIAALLQKFHTNDPTALSAPEVLAMANDNPAKFFGLSGAEIKVGREADFILVDTSHVEMNPSHDFISHLVYAANGTVVDSVVVDGKILMKHRYIEGEEEVIAHTNEMAVQMFDRVDNGK